MSMTHVRFMVRRTIVASFLVASVAGIGRVFGLGRWAKSHRAHPGPGPSGTLAAPRPEERDDTLYITRRKDVHEPVPDDITECEWERVAEADPDLRLSPTSFTGWMRTVTVIPREGTESPPTPQVEEIGSFRVYELTTSPEHMQLSYTPGTVSLHRPNEVARRKAAEIARKLNAVVREPKEVINPG